MTEYDDIFRDKGYDAAIYGTKWEIPGILTIENYEFIDIVRSDSKRYFIDLDFSLEFIIARPTKFYENLPQYLSTIYVSKIDDLKQISKVTSEATKRSLKSEGIYLLLWRKHHFMQNK